MSRTRVSIVLPIRNGGPGLPVLLDAFRSQRVDADIELVAVDSGSTDGTVEILRQRVDRLIEIPHRHFNHGTTRNLGVEAATGELVVLFVHDALPASDTWLASLIAPLRADPAIAGAFARQIPWPAASAIAKHYLAMWVASRDTSRTVSLTRGEFDAMAPVERHDRCAFDDVCSCIRKSVWERHPFRATPIAEDLGWARDVLLAGHRISFVGDAVVIHSHDQSLRYELLRTRDVHRRLFELFELRTIPSLRLLARAMAVTAAINLRCEGFRPARIPRALGLAVVWPLGQYLGARAAVRERAAALPEPGTCES